MNLNPITALSEQLEKLINEHGSAAILRDHLAMFKDQVMILEKKAALLETENTILKTENIELKSKVEKLTKDNEKLRSKIQQYDQPSHKTLLDEDKIKILQYLALQTRHIMDLEIANLLKMNIQVVKFHLDELEKINMAHGTLTMGQPRTWALIQDGRKYLIENKLLS